MLADVAPTSVRFEAGARSATVTLATADDAVVEGAGTVTVTLAAGSGYVLGETATAVLTVEDDDAATFAVSLVPEEIDEGGSAVLTVALANGVTFAREQSIALSATGSATPADYGLAPSTLALATGAGSATATLTALADVHAEDAETVTVTATHDGAAVGSAMATIRANDAPPPLVATVSADAATVTEGSTAAFTVVLDAPARAPLSVAATVSETRAVLSGRVPTRIEFAVGERQKRLALATVDDAVVEGAGTVTVTLAAGSGYVLGETATAVLTVEDDDAATFSVTAAQDEIEEGGGTSVTVTVEGGVTFAEEQSIALSMGGTAAADDYELSANPLTLVAGATSVAATLTALDDAAQEPRETVTVTATHDGVAAGLVTVAIRASDIPSDDATLSRLELTNVDFGTFDPGRQSYAAEVAADVETTTVTATPNDAGASVEVADRFGSTLDAHRTVTLAHGSNEIAVTVTAEDGATVRTYTVSVARSFQRAWGERVPERDIAVGPNPSGIWSDGETLWAVTDFRVGQVSAYVLSDGTRLPARDIRLRGGSGFPAGLWSDGATLWVADYNGGVTAQRLSDGTRLPAADLDGEALAAAGNHQPTGLWSDGATVWVADYGAWKVFAYRLSDKARLPEREFDLFEADSAQLTPFGLWSDGRTAMVSGSLRDRVFGYRLADGALRPGLLLEMTGSGSPLGLWSDGRTLWVVDDRDHRAHAYAVPGLGGERVGQTFPIRATQRAQGVPAAAVGGLAVPIADAALRARIAAALGKPVDAVVGERELAALTSLDARGAGVADLAGLEYAVNLMALDIGANPLADLRSLAALPALEVLILDGVAADLLPVAALTGLRRLSLRGAGVEDVGILLGLTELEALDLGDNRIADLAPLEGLPGLVALRADGNPLAEAPGHDVPRTWKRSQGGGTREPAPRSSGR